MNGGIELAWKTSNEFSLAGYELERSADGRNFYNIGSVHATNTAAAKTYGWKDNAPQARSEFLPAEDDRYRSCF
ncbi:MAG: hypothetical protein WDO71_08410 [Bacteroidota bacterium]